MNGRRFMLLAAIAAVLLVPVAVQAESNDGDRQDEVKREFRGGHVEFGKETPDPASAEANAVRHLPDVIRWVLEHKGERIARGDVIVSHYTIRNWRTVRDPITGRRHRIPLPNTYRGYVGWKP
jgi:hypothetical protein